MAGFNNLLEHGRIARREKVSQSKKLMRAIKGIYFHPRETATETVHRCDEKMTVSGG
jgi:hypothetical protein